MEPNRHYMNHPKVRHLAPHCSLSHTAMVVAVSVYEEAFEARPTAVWVPIGSKGMEDQFFLTYAMLAGVVVVPLVHGPTDAWAIAGPEGMVWSLP